MVTWFNEYKLIRYIKSILVKIAIPTYTNLDLYGNILIKNNANL